MTQDEKLKMFFDISMEDANKQNIEKISLYKEILDKKYEEHVDEQTKRADTRLKSMIDTYRREKYAELSEKQMEHRKKHAEVKKQYIDEIFDEVTQRLMEFKKTPEYKEMLISHIKMARSYCSGDEQMTIYVDKSDFTDVIYNASDADISECNILKDDGKMLGGFIAHIPERNISIDESFASVISEQKQNFVF